LSLRELLTLLARRTAGRHVVGVDIVELNPERDAGGATTAIVTELLVYLLDRLDHAGTVQ
jgi:arginase family enzyme